MLRRLFALILALTCAFAPGMAAFELAAQPAEDCCCGTTCPCPPVDCAALPVTPSSKTTANPAPALAQRIVARVRAHIARAAFADFVSARSVEPVLAVRADRAHDERSAGSVALFQAHCSLLI